MKNKGGTCEKLLGVTVDNKIIFNKHLNERIKKAKARR